MRPLLVPDAFIRSYVGDRGWGHVLVRRARGRRLWLSRVERAVADACNGQRTEAQIAREAGERMGHPVPEHAWRAALERLREAGLLIEDEDEGIAGYDAEGQPLADESGAGAGSAAPPPTPRGLEVVELGVDQAARIRLSLLPGVTLGCDGRGGCCKLYDLVMLRPVDVAALREAYGDEGHLPGGLTLTSSLSYPRADATADELMAIASVDGACMVLEADGKCGVHRQLGFERKPFGCAEYPCRDVLCDDELAVGFAVECRCAVELSALDESPRGGGAQTTGIQEAASLDDLPRAAQALLVRRSTRRKVERVAAEVPATSSRSLSRAAYVAWRAAAAERLAGSEDVVAWALAEAAGLDGDTAPVVSRGGPAIARMHRFVVEARHVIEEAAEYLAFEAWNAAEVYSAADLQLDLLSWSARSAGRLIDAIAAGGAPLQEQAGERLVARQALHLHELVRALDLQSALLSLALRLLIARGDDGVRRPELIPVSSIQYLQRASYLGRLLEEAAPRLVVALHAADAQGGAPHAHA